MVEKRLIRLLRKLGFLGKTGNFCADLPANFAGTSKDMAEKLDVKDPKKWRFNEQMKFPKKSIVEVKTTELISYPKPWIKMLVKN